MSKKLNPVIFGMLKFERLNQQRGKGGQRRIGRARRDIDQAPEDLPARGEGPSEEFAAREQRRGQYRIVLRQLRTHTKNRTHRRLLTRRLFRGEPIVAIAKSLGLTAVNARTVVMRAKEHLGLKTGLPDDHDAVM